jgi:glutamate-1-semialdehyde 2,1-aminomutase
MEDNMFGIPWKNNNTLQKRASKIMPLGVNSNFRVWGDGITPYVQKAKRAYLWDMDGNKYIDSRMAFGPILLGHAYDEVNEKVKQEIENGRSDGPYGVLPVQRLEEQLPW